MSSQVMEAVATKIGSFASSSLCRHTGLIAHFETVVAVVGYSDRLPQLC